MSVVAIFQRRNKNLTIFQKVFQKISAPLSKSILSVAIKFEFNVDHCFFIYNITISIVYARMCILLTCGKYQHDL